MEVTTHKLRGKAEAGRIKFKDFDIVYQSSLQAMNRIARDAFIVNAINVLAERGKIVTGKMAQSIDYSSYSRGQSAPQATQIQTFLKKKELVDYWNDVNKGSKSGDTTPGEIKNWIDNKRKVYGSTQKNKKIIKNTLQKHSRYSKIIGYINNPDRFLKVRPPKDVEARLKPLSFYKFDSQSRQISRMKDKEAAEMLSNIINAKGIRSSRYSYAGSKRENYSEAMENYYGYLKHIMGYDKKNARFISYAGDVPSIAPSYKKESRTIMQEIQARNKDWYADKITELTTKIENKYSGRLDDLLDDMAPEFWSDLDDIIEDVVYEEHNKFIDSLWEELRNAFKGLRPSDLPKEFRKPSKEKKTMEKQVDVPVNDRQTKIPINIVYSDYEIKVPKGTKSKEGKVLKANSWVKCTNEDFSKYIDKRIQNAVHVRLTRLVMEYFADRIRSLRGETKSWTPRWSKIGESVASATSKILNQIDFSDYFDEEVGDVIDMDVFLQSLGDRLSDRVKTMYTDFEDIMVEVAKGNKTLKEVYQIYKDKGIGDDKFVNMLMRNYIEHTESLQKAIKKTEESIFEIDLDDEMVTYEYKKNVVVETDWKRRMEQWNPDQWLDKHADDWIKRPTALNAFAEGAPGNTLIKKITSLKEFKTDTAISKSMLWYNPLSLDERTELYKEIRMEVRMEKELRQTEESGAYHSAMVEYIKDKERYITENLVVWQISLYGDEHLKHYARSILAREFSAMREAPIGRESVDTKIKLSKAEVEIVEKRWQQEINRINAEKMQMRKRLVQELKNALAQDDLSVRRRRLALEDMLKESLSSKVVEEVVTHTVHSDNYKRQVAVILDKREGIAEAKKYLANLNFKKFKESLTTSKAIMLGIMHNLTTITSEPFKKGWSKDIIKDNELDKIGAKITQGSEKSLEAGIKKMVGKIKV